MKSVFLSIPLAILLAAVAVVATGQAQAVRPSLAIRYVSAQRVFAESTDGKAQVARLQALTLQRNGELRARQQTLEGLRQQLAQATDAAQRGQLQQQETQQRTDLERATGQAQLDIQNLQRQIQTEVQGRLKGAIDDLTKTDNLQLVLNADQAVLWAAPGMDLTSTVIERMNSRSATPLASAAQGDVLNMFIGGSFLDFEVAGSYGLFATLDDPRTEPSMLVNGNRLVAAINAEAEIVSTGGTPNLANLGRLEGATEHRPGTYIFNDRMQVACGSATLEDCALHVYATVVSRAAPERGILDAGSKTLTADPGGGLDGYGLILEHPEARIKGFAEEHGFLDLAACNDRPRVGDLVRVIPNHVCVVVNMVDRLIAVRGHDLVGEMPVAARGRIS